MATASFMSAPVATTSWPPSSKATCSASADQVIHQARARAEQLAGLSAVALRAARNAGIKVVAVSYGYSERPAADLGADAVMADFNELPTVLARWS